MSHAVVWIDHVSAHIQRFDAEQVSSERVHARVHATAQHRSGVRTEHEFFGAVCDALKGIEQVLVTGSHTAIADFGRYAEKHRPHAAARVAGYQVIDHPTDKQLVAQAREFFARRERLGLTA